ncbi:MAG: alpha-2-macroglobulin family protein [Xanthobacteraceae bacterium]
MLSSVRVGIVAALFVCLPFIASAADKSFQRDDLADSAIRLEAKIKADSGTVAKPAAALKRDADAAFQKNDARTGLQVLGQIATVAPNDSSNWLRMARTILQIWAPNDQEREALLERGATAAYIAYQRAGTRDEEADSLILLSRTFADRKIWRPALDSLRLALEARETADARGTYEKMREDHGFRLLDYTVDSDSATPRACFQFSEALPGRRVDLSPFVSVGGQDKPAISVDDQQLCVEGLKHGERYAMTLRPGLPSTVKETLSKPSNFSIYVRDRSPTARFAGKAYVLPRTGQRGIPIVSVNTPSVKVQVYRIGDRNLLNSVVSEDFQRNLGRYEFERLSDERGALVWKGDLAVENQLNADVTTAFPVTEAVGTLAPGVYVMSAEPAGPSANDYDSLATQWFIVSDLGVTAHSGNDGVHVYVNSLASAAGLGDVDVKLIARNNEVLATKKTDANGYAAFDAGLARGEGGQAPALITVTNAGGDYAFLNLKGPAFDLSDRGVTGRETPAGLDAFVYTERGVYRTGETVHVTALARDEKGNAAQSVPLTMVVERPDGVEYRRAVVADQGLGGRNLDVPIAATASTGTWKVRVFSDPKKAAIGEASFLVEDYVPDRIEFELTSKLPAISKSSPVTVTVDGHYLYGAPASDLSLEGEVKIKPVMERKGFAGYQFGVTEEKSDDEESSAIEQPLEDLPSTDAQGKASFPVALDKLPEANSLFEAQVVVRMAESGGRAVERSLTLPVTPATAMIGVKPLFAGNTLGEGETATFDVIVLSPEGQRVARSNLRYELFKIESKYQWYRRDGSWNYEPIRRSVRIADGTLNVTTGDPGRISAPVQWGRYRLDVASADPGGPTTSVSFDAGFYAEASADTPDLLEMALDKSEYRPGEAMTVAITARTAGVATINVTGSKLLVTVRADVKEGVNRVPVNVGNDWGNGAYLVATLRRPLDAAAQRMPGRAIGVQWFSIDRKARTLAVNLTLPQLIRPNSSLRIPVKIDGLAAGEEARIVVAAVDVGILNLTGYKPPAPDDYFLGQRALSAEIRDLYGQLIDGMQGARGQIRSGGDASAAELQGSPPAQAPLALYSGIVTVGADGTATVSFDVPDFAGTARVMAVAWSKDKVGRANGDVTIRDPVVLTATLPRFMLNGDRSTANLEVDNVEGPAGDYHVSVQATGPVAAEGGIRVMQLAAKQRSSITVPLTASGAGIAAIKISIAGPANYALERNYTLVARAATQTLTRRTVRPIARGDSITISPDLFADLVPGTGSVALSIGPSVALDAATLLKALDRYPFGCSEQITSRALPLLYVNELASEAHLSLDTAIDQRIKDAIERLLARQGSNGSFGLWSVGGDDPWLDSYVTDFLTRAREKNFAVSDVSFKLALDRLRNFVANAPDPSKSGGVDLAYALYVLARNGVAPIGDLRYVADTKLDDISTPIAKAQIAAALGMLGDRARAERVYAAAVTSIAPPPRFEYGRSDYGSTLRDSAAVVTLAAEGGAPSATVMNAIARVESSRAAATYTSTQENAWMVMAALALGKETRMSLRVAGETRQNALYRTFRAADVSATGIKAENLGVDTLQAVVSVSGAPITPEPAAERGFKIERNYFTLAGEKVDPSKVKQNTRLAVVLKITEPSPQYGRLIVADYLPAGFEIDNPSLVSSGETSALDWIENGAEPVHSEFRDDHFGAAFDRTSRDQAVFTVAYVVRAVSPGKYVLPQAYVEDMYRPDRYGRTATGSVEVTSAK